MIVLQLLGRMQKEESVGDLFELKSILSVFLIRENPVQINIREKRNRKNYPLPKKGPEER